MPKTTPLLAQAGPYTDAAVEAGLIGQPEPILTPNSTPFGAIGWNLVTALYIVGGCLAIYAALLFSSLVVESYGKKGMLAVALCYAAVSFGLAVYLQAVLLSIPACVFAIISMVMVPVAVHSVCCLMGHEPEKEDAVRCLVHLSCIAMGVVVLSTFSYPFMVVPLVTAVSLFLLDMIPSVWNDVVANDFKAYFFFAILLVLGLVLLASGFVAHLITSKAVFDFAFWLFLTGGAAFELGMFDLLFEGGVKHIFGDRWINACKVACLLVNIGLVLIGAGIGRHVLAILAGIGACAVSADLIYSNMEEKWARVATVALAGMLLMAIGIMFAKSSEIAAILQLIIPSATVLAALFSLIATAAVVAGALYLAYLKKAKGKGLADTE